MMKKKLAMVLSAAMLVGALAGCGGTDSSSSSTGAKDTAKKGDFPTKTITLICNYGAGGGTDLASRALASAMEKTLGVPVSVVNKPGGSATIGVTEVLNAKADGYTFGVCSYSPMVIAPHQMQVAYTPDSFDYLGTLSQYDYGVLVKGDSPYQDIDDLVEGAKANGGLNMMGSGYPHPLVIEGLAELTGTDIQFVNMNSSSEVVTGLLGGHCDAISLVMSDATSYIESGELRLIASSNTERLEDYPDVPTLQEQGYDLSVQSYMGLGLPKGVDPERIAVLQDAFDKAFDDPDFQKTMENLSIHVKHISGEEFYELLKTDYDFYADYFAEKGE
ncbi:tripartite tricarboxylate transporter substrate binding protein [Intestinibacillus massiliensis]|uniref:tripartite tricarboxylate transporter substrate binding protein n=1 Tax=Intestinibacillus massiliensis TaxID=1871029 RepID=UPI000B3537FF|nr:tripartite tricarboxylate transporter substrate binding protein [Intestinibacillus massiliensis]